MSSAELRQRNAERFARVYVQHGENAALEYARQCVHVYRRAVLSSSRGNLFRRNWIESYLFFKREVCRAES